MATTVRYTKSSGVVTPTIKLNELEANEGDYDIIKRGGDMEENYQNVKTERKTNSDKTGVEKEKRDKTKIVIALLGCIVSGLVVAVVLSNLVLFSILQKFVTNGKWTSWGDWGACSVTCGIGITTRIRTCSNPRPSTMGQYCEGTSDQVQICGNSSCSVTDGGWTDWEDWGACSVACGTGFTTRIRTCSNPRPSIMGRYCDGTFLQVLSCKNTSCSVTDGGWTDLEDWRACSVTCGTGFTTRIRTCSNPRPSIMGRYCYGTSLQVQSCKNTSCSVTDGSWTDWEDWGACSVTCGTGFTTRIRTCSNPRPSIMGRYCDGTSLQVQSCKNTSCSVTDGGWTDWEDWGACSVTCGTGFTTRIWTCSNPRTSIMGRYCDGTSVQVQSCKNSSCSGESVGFTVHWPYANSGGNPLTFKTALYNNNDVFNMTSGEFVCQREGPYLFISVLLRTDNTSSYISCNFYKNNDKSIAYGSFASSNSLVSNPSSSSSILYHLKPGDRVYLGSCKGMQYMANGSGFTGLLINPMH
ncbi:hemicentin-1-like isoform X1 [Mercenaria mercenaria]|uniref:hemicentin-1-like isoform X1 n=1 Tax=Mercenaria mercenaria TaxID=6596 RepID=UPI00234E43AA|nr:hemicentin-1-like isoform X1 [Mercenaria mercenaria]